MAGPTNLRANIGWMLLWQVSNYVIPLLTFPYLTRVLGPRGFGEYGIGFAVATYLVVVTDWGHNFHAPGEISRRRDDPAAVSRIFWSVLGSKTLLVTICLVVLGCVCLLSDAVGRLAPVLFAAAGMAVANVLTVNWCLQGFERLGKSAIALTVGRALTVPATILLVHAPGDAWIAAGIQSVGAMIGGLVSLYLVWRLGVIGRQRIGVADIRAQLVDSFPLFVSALSINLYTTTNTVMLGLLHGPHEVGVFAAADRVRAAAQGIINPVSQAIHPHVSRLMHTDREQGLRFARRLLVLQGGAMLAISLTLFAGAGLIVGLLAGPRYGEAVPVLRWLAIIPFSVGLANVMGTQMLLPLGMKASFSRILAFAAVCDLLLVVPLSWYFGATGTAVAAAMAELIVASCMAATLHRRGIVLIPGRADLRR